MYCNNKEKEYNNKCYIVLLVILYVCLLNIVINNVSLSNEDIISKQEFQKLLDIKQNMKESNLYHTQIIQMFKDLIENVNKLNNKVDRLESIISQKKIEEKKQEEENYKVVKAIEVIKPVETDDSILDRAQRIIDEANAQKLLQEQLQSRQVNAEPIMQSQQELLNAPTEEAEEEKSEQGESTSTSESLQMLSSTSQPSTPVILKMTNK